MCTDTTPFPKLVPQEPQADVIATLEKLLEEAKAGEVRAIAFQYVRRGMRVSYGWTNAKESLIMSYTLHSALTTCAVLYANGMDGISTEQESEPPDDAA